MLTVTVFRRLLGCDPEEVLVALVKGSNDGNDRACDVLSSSTVAGRLQIPPDATLVIEIRK